MVVTYENFTLKGRLHHQQSSSGVGCRGFDTDYNSNSMSKSSESSPCVNTPHLDANRNSKDLHQANGSSKVPSRRSYEGSGGKRSSGVLTDVIIEGRNPKRNSMESSSSKECNATQSQDTSSISTCPDYVNRESYCSNESDTNIKQQQYEQQPMPNKTGNVKSKQFRKFTKGLFSKGATNVNAATCENAGGSKGKPGSSPGSPEDSTGTNNIKLSANGTKPKKANSTSTSVGQNAGVKKQESKVRLFNRKRRTRNKLISNAGSSLWTPLGDCMWVSASGRQFALKNTKLFNLCDSERAVLRQIILQKLHELQLGCNITPPKDGNSARRTWKQRLFLGRKDKDENKEPRHFGVSLSQIIANDVEAEEARNRSDLPREETRPPRVVRQAEVSTDECLAEETDPTAIEDTADKRRNSLPESYMPMMRSNSFNLDEGEEIDFLDNKNSDNNNTTERRDGAVILRSSVRRISNSGNHRRSRLLDALTLSSTSASYISIIDRDDELKPAPPQVPKIVQTLIKYIEEHGLNLLGIFRTGGLRKRVRHMREELDRGNTSIIHSEETNPQDVAALFKEFFRDLPDPLLTRELYAPLLATRKLGNRDQQLMALQLLIGLLPVCNRDTLFALLSCLAKVASFSQDTVDGEGNTISGNKMDSRNLATLIGPNILHKVKANSSAQSFSQEDSLRLAEENNTMIEVVKEMIENHEQLFKVSATLHDEVLRSIVDSEPEVVDYVLRKKSSRVSQMDFPDDIQDELGRIQQNSNAHPRRSMTFATSRRDNVPSRYSDEGSFARNSLRAGKNPEAIQRGRKISYPERPGSIRSVMSTASEPDRFSYRKSNSSFLSYNAACTNRRSQSETTEVACLDSTTAPLPNVADQFTDVERYRVSYRDSGLGLGRNSHRFSMEETRRKINALESTHLSANFDEVSTTPYSSPSGTPILERAEQEEVPSPVRLREREFRDCRDSAYASGRLTSRKGGTPFQGLQGVFSLGEEELSPDASMTSSASPTSPVFLTDVLNEPSFNVGDVKKGVPPSRKLSLPPESLREKDEEQDIVTRPSMPPRAISDISENTLHDKKVRKAFLTWEEVTWPHWDREAMIEKSDMPDQETIL
eukprot:gene7407-8227_t